MALQQDCIPSVWFSHWVHITFARANICMCLTYNGCGLASLQLLEDLLFKWMFNSKSWSSLVLLCILVSHHFWWRLAQELASHVDSKMGGQSHVTGVHSTAWAREAGREPGQAVPGGAAAPPGGGGGTVVAEMKRWGSGASLPSCKSPITPLAVRGVGCRGLMWCPVQSCLLAVWKFYVDWKIHCGKQPGCCIRELTEWISRILQVSVLTKT